ncbi:MAG TPA: Fis family transcriptional regulator [Paenibacillaceae bacterium]|nr:Fis family transcriptional regulator [Paenibacillaceae bacterium]
MGFIWYRDDFVHCTSLADLHNPPANSQHIIFIGDPCDNQLEYSFHHDGLPEAEKLKTCLVIDENKIDSFLLQEDWSDIIVFRSNNQLIGWNHTQRLLKRLYFEERNQNNANLTKLDELNRDMQAIFEASFDVLFVANGDGITLRVSSACEKLWGLKAEDLVGKSVYELEEKRIFYPSVTRLVIEGKEKVSILQTTKTGRKLLAVGIPIKDEMGNVIRVVNGSRDVTEWERLQEELEETKKMIHHYKEQFLEGDAEEGIVYQSPQMEQVFHYADKVSEVDSTILITGESGVGKEVVAKYIHQKSPRKNNPFIKINCGSIPESLIESELFGYENGAFTGALKHGKVGLIEAANNGTLFLDEIGDLPFHLQVKLLRVLQEKELTRVGGTRTIKINIRIAAATNKNLNEEVKRGNFREDLYYRLNVIPLEIPSLRERKDDIPLLIQYYGEQFSKQYMKKKTFSSNTIELFKQYPWPGNIRELKNIVERLIVLTDHDLIQNDDLPSNLRQPDSVARPCSPVEVHQVIPLKTARTLLEKKLIDLASKNHTTTMDLAKVLEVNQSTVSRMLKKLTESY